MHVVANNSGISKHTCLPYGAWNDFLLLCAGCSDKCVSGFLGTEGVKRFFADNPNVNLVNYRGRHRLLPALNFTCSTTITSISVGARRASGAGTPQIQIWRTQEGQFSRVHRIHLAEMTTAEDPGVYEFTVTGSVAVQEGDVVSVYETMSSSLELYNERDAGIYPLSTHIDEGNGNFLLQDDDWPLLSIETGNEQFM